MLKFIKQSISEARTETTAEKLKEVDTELTAMNVVVRQVYEITEEEPAALAIANVDSSEYWKRAKRAQKTREKLVSMWNNGEFVSELEVVNRKFDIDRVQYLSIPVMARAWAQ